jgi:hypothetical protein
MKDRIKGLIDDYDRRIRALDILNEQANDNLSKVRLGAKKSVYEDVIKDLKKILENVKDTA